MNLMKKISILAMSIVAMAIWATLLNLGFASFQVNSSSGAHERSIVALSQNKGFVIVWRDKTLKNILAQRYDKSGKKVGVEFSVASTTDDENEPSVAMNDSGAFVIAWKNNANKNIYSQLYDINGNTVGGQTLVTGPENNFGYESIFSSSQGTVREKQIATQVVLTEAATLTSLTAYIDGNNGSVRYAIYSDASGEPDQLKAESASTTVTSGWAWRSIDMPNVSLIAGTYWLAVTFDQDSQQYKYDASGGQTRVANYDAELLGYRDPWGVSNESNTRKISIYATYAPVTDDKKPRVAMADDGSFVIAMESKAIKGDIYIQRYDANGSAIGAAIQVTSSSDDEKDPSIAITGDGKFVVAWNNVLSKDVYAQRYDSSGSALGSVIQVTSSLDDEKVPRIAMTTNGAFVIAWENKTTLDVYAQRYDASGSATGSAIQVTTSLDDEKGHSISINDGGAFVIAWENKTNMDVFAQRYNVDGSKNGAEIQVTTSINQDKIPSVAMNQSGRFVVVWSNKIDASTENIFGQLYESDGSASSIWVVGVGVRVLKWIEVK